MPQNIDEEFIVVRVDDIGERQRVMSNCLVNKTIRIGILSRDV